MNNSEHTGCSSSSECVLQEARSKRVIIGMQLAKAPLLSVLEGIRVERPPPSRSHHRRQPHHHQPMSEKLKASNFPITKITVGAWQRVSRHEGELTAKLYFAKKKLVWEFLDGQLKSKMEVSWSDITAINAVMHPSHQPGFLQIQLGKPPLFFRELTPQPRKHTNWQQASDFTDGQAPLYRIHRATFPPGALDKHYEKLVLCDQNLFELSRRPFPSHESPYFNTVVNLPLQLNMITTNNGVVQQQQQQSFHHYPQQLHYPTPPSMAPPSPLHPSLNPIITQEELGFVAAGNSEAAAMWGNQITYVDDSLQQQQQLLISPRHDYYDQSMMVGDDQCYECDVDFPPLIDQNQNQNVNMNPMMQQQLQISPRHGYYDQLMMVEDDQCYECDVDFPPLIDQNQNQNVNVNRMMINPNNNYYYRNQSGGIQYGLTAEEMMRINGKEIMRINADESSRWLLPLILRPNYYSIMMAAPEFGNHHHHHHRIATTTNNINIGECDDGEGDLYQIPYPNHQLPPSQPYF